jgi:hypothetical protein
MQWSSLELRSAWLVVGAGVAARLLLLLIVDPTVDPLSGDSAYYVRGALDGMRSPLYGLFAASLYRIAWWMPLAVQSALTIGSGVAATFALRGRFGLITGLLIATCPFFIFYNFRILSESLYINLLWLGWLCLMRSRAIVGGILVGLAILTRDTFVLLPLFTLVSAWLASRIAKSRADQLPKRAILLATVAAYLTVMPWVAYHGSLSQGRMGLNLWAGTWERNSDWFSRGLEKPSFPAYAFRNAAEARTVRTIWPDDPGLLRLALERIKGDPIGVAAAWAVRYPKLWIGTRSEHIALRAGQGSFSWRIIKASLFGLNLALIAFGLWGLLRPSLLLAVPAAYAALSYIPFHAEARYTLFAYPFLIALGSARLAERWPHRRT